MTDTQDIFERHDNQVMRDIAPSAVPESSPLTQAEVRTLRLLAGGLRTHQVAERERISIQTVKWRLKVICRKLEANNRSHAVALAIRRGLL